MALTVTINSQDVTHHMRQAGPRIVRTAGARPGRCDLSLATAYNHSVPHQVALPITVTDGATTYFDGETRSYRLRETAAGKFEVDITALDLGAVPATSQAPFSLVDWRTDEAAYLWMLGGYPDNLWRLGESSGTTATDAIGSVNGTYVNAPTLGVAGAMTTGNTAVTFNGTDEYVTVGAANLRAQANLTIAAWAKSSSAAANQIIYAERSTLNDALIRFYLDTNGRPTFNWRTDTGALETVVPTSGDWTDGAWHHFAVTKSGTAITIYVDGVSVATGTLAASGAQTSVMTANIGRDPHTADLFFAGSLDEVMLFTLTLGAGEVRVLYANRRMEPYTQLVAEVTWDGVTGATTTATVSTLVAGLEPGQYLTIHSQNNNDLLRQSYLIQEVEVSWLNPTTPLYTATVGDAPIKLAAAFP